MDDEPEAPPANADDWSNEQWIAWLKATDDPDEIPEKSRPYRVTHSVGGQLLGNAMIGLARALYGPQKEKPAIVVESGEPEPDPVLDVHLDFDEPGRSYATLRSRADHREQELPS